MRKKKLGSFLLAAAMLVMLTACGEKAPNSTASSSDGQESVPSSASQTAVEETNTTALAGGSGMENAQAVPLDTNLQGKIPKGEKQWFSFTTDETENAVYKITQVNQTPKTGKLRLCVYDAEKNQMNSGTLEAGSAGKAETLSLELLPETTYYIQMWAQKGDVIQYSLILHSPEGQSEKQAVQPGPEAVGGLEIPGATNQMDAQLLPLNAKLQGKVSEDKGQWYAFATNSTENATYKLTTVNMTRGTGMLNLVVYDQYGNELIDPYNPLQAKQSGWAATVNLELTPLTNYYVYIWAREGDTIEYTLTIHAPEATDSQD